MEGSHRRFGAPARALPQPRMKAQGLGQRDPEAIAAEDANYIETTTPTEGFAGFESRSRFTSLPAPIEVGHGGMLTRPGPGSDLSDPAEGRPGSFAPVRWIVDAITWANDLRASADPTALGTDDRVLQERGLLRYKRRRDPVYVAGLRASDLPRWSDAGPVPTATVQRRYTMRREFEQDAQTFSGEHTSLDPADKRPGSRARHRMGAPHTNRLTYRDEPASFGSKTAVLNG